MGCYIDAALGTDSQSSSSLGLMSRHCPKPVANISTLDLGSDAIYTIGVATVIVNAQSVTNCAPPPWIEIEKTRPSLVATVMNSCPES